MSKKSNHVVPVALGLSRLYRVELPIGLCCILAVQADCAECVPVIKNGDLSCPLWGSGDLMIWSRARV